MKSDEYLARVRALIPALRERATACEALRRVPDETFKDFQAHGLLRALQPQRWGGLELDPWTFYEAVMEVAAVCGSSGWVLGVLGVHNWQLALFPEQAQADVWRDDTSVQISSSYAPTGKVERVPGGFRLSGRWSFSSGCDHCDWVFLGGIAPGDGPFPTCARISFRARTTRSTTTGAWPVCAARAARTSWWRAPSCRSIARTASSTRSP